MAVMRETATARLVLDVRAEAGESPWWSAAEQCLYWVDIHQRRVHRFDPVSGVDREWTTPDLVTFVATCSGGGHVVALSDRVCHVDFHTGEYRTIARPRLPPGGRLNDGAVDPRGRLLIGAMTASEAPRGEAALFRIERDASCTLLLDGFRTVNGLAFAPDGRTLYVSDSHPEVRTIWACTYDPVDGAASSRRVFAKTHELPGRPDGGCVDAEGSYWMAAVDGGCLLRFGPSGEVLTSLVVPVEKPSKAAFGGSNLDLLFITSLRRNLRIPLEAQPHAGGLFVAEPGVRGITLSDCDVQ
jgi:sugar lactone lactonase YvrE